MALSIGEVATAAGLRPSALRYYEEVGLIAPLERRGGRRYYDPAVLSRLAFIALCQDVGFTIAEIATLLDGRPNARARWQHLAERKLEDLDLQMQRLRDMRRHLRSALACECDSVDACELIDATAERRPLPPHAVAAQYQALEETAEILSDEDTLAAFSRGLDDLATGNVVPLEHVRDEHAARNR